MKLYSTQPLNEASVVQIAEGFAARVTRVALLCLEGELGAGKSTFARAWIRAVSGEIDVPSPTFSLVQEYRYRECALSLYHGDLYRVRSAMEVEGIGLPEMFQDGVCLIEWASRTPEIFADLMAPVAHLEFSVSDPDLRQLRLRSSDPWWQGVAEGLDMVRVDD
ncbi:MAG: tRNA (adenosine(37)-N6)-threonylcarbamoyltransferase complex ATPase subunit type 1 TsaE [Alphaproteobacteria bacterium]|nr:tRNA (adenosine(37)-N6)-threonylcarbamoyltransferase complex ATPase subunit type 1 TsaE [Alphaproteobacteria bacterium]